MQGRKADEGHKWKVLSLAVGHGLYEITLARHNPSAEVWAVDWANVLQVARENAAKAGVAARYHTIPGSAFEVNYGEDYDLALVVNFLHHFDLSTCEKLLRKVHGALRPGGRAVILEFVPNEDRVSPPLPASFSLIMLAGTPAGDAYAVRVDRRYLEHSIQTRENVAKIATTIPYAEGSREDTGHAIFHSNSGGFLACASCHPEGGDDGVDIHLTDVMPAAYVVFCGVKSKSYVSVEGDVVRPQMSGGGSK